MFDSAFAVLVSAGLHAQWNFLLRRAGGGTLIVALSKVAEVALLLPVFMVLLVRLGPLSPARYLPAVAVGGMFVLANYLALAAAYRRGDLSLVYPVARGGIFLFLPVLGLIVFNERLGAASWLALALILGGTTCLPLDSLAWNAVRQVRERLRSGAIGFALLAAFTAAAYTIWDKFAVGFLDAFLYFYGYTALIGVFFGAMVARATRAEVAEQWLAHRGAIVLIALLNSTAYLLVLLALRTGASTQVLAVRQLSIPIGVLLGWRFLAERVTPPRALGAILITAGCTLAAFD